MHLHRYQLKYLAAFAMLLDHIGVFFLTEASPLWVLCRFLGRLACPMMCFFLAEGFRYTRSRPRYLCRLVLFALLSQPIYAYAFFQSPWGMRLNMLVSLTLCFLMLWCCEAKLTRLQRTVLLVLLFVLSLACDWSIYAPLFTLTFYLLRKDQKQQNLVFLLLAFCYAVMCFSEAFWAGKSLAVGLISFGVLLFFPLRACYSGQEGSQSRFHKWFFYVFYPIHLLVLMLIQKL